MSGNVVICSALLVSRIWAIRSHSSAVGDFFTEVFAGAAAFLVVAGFGAVAFTAGFFGFGFVAVAVFFAGVLVAAFFAAGLRGAMAVLLIGYVFLVWRR